MKTLFGAVLVSSLAACSVTLANNDSLPALPTPVSNNAVAAVTLEDGVHLYSFLGLTAGKTYRDVKAAAFQLAPGSDAWRTLPPPPGPGRLAATAVAVDRHVYLFGGYTVAADGSEKSIETVHKFDPLSGNYQTLTPMPVPVDDTLSAVYAQRYIYLVSGWHDSGNVNLVQVYDVEQDMWFQATPYPGKPVFGQAGGIAGNTLLVCGGVYVRTTEAAREFAPEQGCLRGDIRPADPTRIDWRTVNAHPGPGRYRAASASDGNHILFAGGSSNPYNFNGIGYNKIPSEATASVFAFDVSGGKWHTQAPLRAPSMDHRGMLALGDGRFAIIGGMRDGQEVTADVMVWSPAPSTGE